MGLRVGRSLPVRVHSSPHSPLGQLYRHPSMAILIFKMFCWGQACELPMCMCTHEHACFFVTMHHKVQTNHSSPDNNSSHSIVDRHALLVWFQQKPLEKLHSWTCLEDEGSGHVQRCFVWSSSTFLTVGRSQQWIINLNCLTLDRRTEDTADNRYDTICCLRPYLDIEIALILTLLWLCSKTSIGFPNTVQENISFMKVLYICSNWPFV